MADQDIHSDPESEVTRGRRIDVLAEVAGRKVAIECKKGTFDSQREKAMAAAARRVADKLAKAAVAVCYPDGLDLDRFGPETRILAAPLGGAWSDISVTDLAGMVRRASDNLETIDATSSAFKESLKAAAAHLSTGQVKDIVDGVEIPLGSKQPALRAALLVASACLFHARLDDAGYRKPSKDARTGKKYDGEGWPPKPLRRCMEGTDPVRELEKSWDTILAVDYKPVFETALATIGAPRAYNPDLAAFIRGCGYAALAAAGSLTGGQASGQTDLLGRVFHYILDEKKNTGAFYTSSSAGALIASLAIREEDVDRDLDYSVVDPACGTGTLLAAAAARIQDISGQTGALGGRKLIEDVLHGYDIDITAAHLAAVTLGLMAPDVAFSKMNVHRFPLGMVDDEFSGGEVARIGSLELIGEDGFARTAKWPTSPRSEHIDTGEDEDIEAIPRNLVIMNPPFSRDSLRHDQLGELAELRVKEREKQLFRFEPSVGTHSGGMFLCLADRLCDSDSGTVALVYPTSSCGAPSARKVWAKLWETFHLEMVITSHDPKRIFFSENTSINESLFLLRRKKDGDQDAPTRFIQLTQNPAAADDASTLAGEIRNLRESDRFREVGWPRERVEADDWTPARFLSSHLAETTFKWFSGGALSLVPMGRIAAVGPHGRRIRGDCRRRPRGTTAKAGMWFNNQVSAQFGAPAKQTLRVSPDCSIEAKPGKEGATSRHWEQRGRLFLPEKTRLTVGMIFAATTDQPAVGSMWIPAQAINPMDGWEEAMCVYLNSTVGIMAHLLASTPTSLERPEMSMDGMRAIFVPNLTEDRIAILAAVYDDVKDKPLLRLRDQADDQVVRHRLDAAVCEAMDWDAEEIAGVRAELAAEPSVTGNPVGEAG